MKRISAIVLTLLAIAVLATAASAVPRLQTYIVGSQYYNRYGAEADSWISNDNNFDLKVVGYWRPSGTAGGYQSLRGGRPGMNTTDYMDCFLMVSTPREQAGTVWVNGIELTGFGAYSSTVPNGVDANPSLRRHMPVGVGLTSFASIGRIDNNQVNAFDYSHGCISNPGWGDELLVNVVTSGYSWVHFDAVGIDSRGNTFVNPYSHDASYYDKEAPEPGTLSLLGLGLLGMIPALRKKRD